MAKYALLQFKINNDFLIGKKLLFFATHGTRGRYLGAISCKTGR
ncbi:MAG: hypothetical protein CM15mP54_27640 [Paracoccaceae bacterium]|nr:MAG: hypothetical protein CM15mP54_27640 [Paracoccaceae bacterium]